jgi:gliding motility-associated-like protein
MMRNSRFLIKIVFLSILLSFITLVFSQVNNETTQYINICDNSFILKKYYVLPPPPGYSVTWILDSSFNIQGNVNSDVIYVKWENKGIYNIIVQYSNGDCFSQNELTVIVNECPDVTLFVPNAFTPNGDQINDVFGAYGEGIKEFDMSIFNRWGELVFKSSNIEYRWDGNYLGRMCQDDVYLYSITYKGIDNKFRHIYNGKISLIRH